MNELEGCVDMIHGVASLPGVVDLNTQSIEHDAIAESNVGSALAAATQDGEQTAMRRAMVALSHHIGVMFQLNLSCPATLPT